MQPATRTLATLASGALLGFLVAVGGDVRASRDAAAIAPVPVTADLKATSWQDVGLMREVLDRVRREYVQAVSDDELLNHAVHGLVAGLDPYSAFLDRDEYEEMRVSTTGRYPGVGIEVAAARDAIRVVRPFEQSPAARAGLRAGDLVVSINGETVGNDVEAAIARMRGPAGSAVHLSVRRTGETLPLEFVLQRAQVDVHSVTAARLAARLGYVRITHFSATTPQDFRLALSDLSSVMGSQLAGVVIDVRNNPGGVLEAAVEIADLLLETGTIVSADGRTPDARFRMSAEPGDLLAGTPVVVLVNGASASAAEILAGALQDNGRAVLVGRRTFGKGSVQTVMPLSQGRAIKLTTSHYFTPSGRSINGRGIEPDVLLQGPDPDALDLSDPVIRSTLSRRDSDIAAAVAALEAAPDARSTRRLTAGLR